MKETNAFIPFRDWEASTSQSLHSDSAKYVVQNAALIFTGLVQIELGLSTCSPIIFVCPRKVLYLGPSQPGCHVVVVIGYYYNSLVASDFKKNSERSLKNKGVILVIIRIDVRLRDPFRYMNESCHRICFRLKLV